MYMKLKTLPIFLAFIVMGVADAMGPMSDAVKNQYELSNVMATMLSFFVFIAFAVFSVPGGLLAARIGKKKLLLLGLGLNAVAMLVPSLIVPGFALLLGCIFVLGVGTTFLQVAGNPIMRDVSAEKGPTAATSVSLRASRGSAVRVSTYLVTAITAIALLPKHGLAWSVPDLLCPDGCGLRLGGDGQGRRDQGGEPPSIGSAWAC